ncbi:hypothetical protein JCM14076_11620 [Methylosoma difficile]
MKNLLKLLPALLIILVAGAVSAYWLSHKPRAERAPVKAVLPLVDVLQPKAADFQTTIEVMGNVIASQSVNLTPRISGMVIGIGANFIEGGLLKEGEQLVELDPTDFLLAIKQSENDLAKARYNLQVEQGQQAIVRREFQLLGQDLKAQEQDLVLRKPHLQAAQAAVAAAEASLKQAHLNLERTKPVAPFNAIITTRNANLGAWMSAFSTGTPLAKLVGTDTFWVNVSVPVDKLRWIKIPGINSQQGSPVKISYETGWGKDVYRDGVVKRLQAELEPEGRMAKLIIEIDDPLVLKAANKKLPPLMLGTYVRVDIPGTVLKDAIELPDAIVHDGQYLWLLTPEQTLDIHPIQPLWHDHGNIYLSKAQLPEGAKVIISDLSAPVQGMALRTAAAHD